MTQLANDPGNAPQQSDELGLIIVTGADERYFAYASDLVLSLEACQPFAVSLGFYDFGLTSEQRDWLLARGVIVRRPRSGLVFNAYPEQLESQMGYLARPFLRENFPGYAVYIWLDADVWLQSWAGVQALWESALLSGAAMVCQTEPSYRFWPWLLGWQFKHFVRGYGVAQGLSLAWRPHINNGVLAMRADAPHWSLWRERYQSALDRTLLPAPHDQFSLNAAVRLDRPPTKFLPSVCNWICDLAVPMWNTEQQMFCIPRPPYTPIPTLHLAGNAKTGRYDIKATDGTSGYRPLRFGHQDAALFCRSRLKSDRRLSLLASLQAQ